MESGRHQRPHPVYSGLIGSVQDASNIKAKQGTKQQRFVRRDTNLSVKKSCVHHTKVSSSLAAEKIHENAHSPNHVTSQSFSTPIVMKYPYHLLPQGSDVHCSVARN